MWTCQHCGTTNEDYYLNCMHCTYFKTNQDPGQNLSPHLTINKTNANKKHPVHQQIISHQKD